MKSIADVVAQYNKRGFKINVILGDPEFKSIKDQLNKLFGITLNITSKSEHVPEIERGIRTLKERIRATISRLPYNQHLPRVIVREVVINAVMMLNAFPPRSGINTSMSPRTIISGVKLDYNKHCKMPFGDYAQTHEEDTP